MRKLLGIYLCMPELPDLVYIRNKLKPEIENTTITKVEVKKPLLMRKLIDGNIEELLKAKTIVAIELKSPFLQFNLSDDLFLVCNLMLTGKLQYQKEHQKPGGYLALSISLDNGSKLNLLDEKQMAKAYLAGSKELGQIPKYKDLGLDLNSDLFTEAYLLDKIKKERRQVRVFIMDSSIFSSIGNAYADEILFAAKLHPKTPCNRLSQDQRKVLYQSMSKVLANATSEVETANKDIHIKVRDFLKVRNKKGKPCPNCGTTIRRAGVYGHDTFFCPKCQAEPDNSWLKWQK